MDAGTVTLFQGILIFHIHSISSLTLISSSHILQALVSRARGCHHGPAGSAPCPSHPSPSTALTCRPWSATRPTLSSPCSTTPAPAPPPVAPMVTSPLGQSGKTLLLPCNSFLRISQIGLRLKIFNRKPVVQTGRVKEFNFEEEGAGLMKAWSLHYGKCGIQCFWSLTHNTD